MEAETGVIYSPNNRSIVENKQVCFRGFLHTVSATFIPLSSVDPLARPCLLSAVRTVTRSRASPCHQSQFLLFILLPFQFHSRLSVSFFLFPFCISRGGASFIQLSLVTIAGEFIGVFLRRLLPRSVAREGDR